MKAQNTLFLIFSIGLILTYSLLAEGADWKLWHKGSDGILFYYDIESITHPSGDIVRVRGKIEGSNVVVINPKTEEIDKSFKTKNDQCVFEFNCLLKKYRMLSSQIEYEDGRQEKKENSDREWIHITPKSFFELFYKEVCVINHNK